MSSIKALKGITQSPDIISAIKEKDAILARTKLMLSEAKESPASNDSDEPAKKPRRKYQFTKPRYKKSTKAMTAKLGMGVSTNKCLELINSAIESPTKATPAEVPSAEVPSAKATPAAVPSAAVPSAKPTNETPDTEPPQPVDLTWDNIYEAIEKSDITQGAVMQCSVVDVAPVVVDETRAACTSCGSDLIQTDGVFICKGCGVELDTAGPSVPYSTAAITDCNVNSDVFMALKIVGRDSYRNNRSLVAACGDYNKHSRFNTEKTMMAWNHVCKKHSIPKSVIRIANEMYCLIREKRVYRKNGKNGVISACLYYACLQAGISKTPTEIASFTGIEDRFHSKGDRILRGLNEEGIIKLPDKVNPISDYTTRYMQLLDIDLQHRPFVLDLIATAEKHNLHVLHDSKNNTKCVGSLYMLVERIPDLKKRISKDLIEKECNISKTTFLKYYNMIHAYYKLFKKVFKKHGVAMPLSWKDSTSTVSS
jgi:hypothetical protein